MEQLLCMLLVKVPLMVWMAICFVVDCRSLWYVLTTDID